MAGRGVPPSRLTDDGSPDRVTFSVADGATLNRNAARSTSNARAVAVTFGLPSM